MNTRQQATLPPALSKARRQFDKWRSRHRKHTRLPQELWRQAVALACEHGLNKTSRALGLKYYSLKKHLDQMTTDQAIPAKAEPDFIELLPGEGVGQEKETESGQKAKGHGRNGVEEYVGAEKTRVPHESLKPGDACPNCKKGTVYESVEPGHLVRIRGQAPLGATVYELQKLPEDG